MTGDGGDEAAEQKARLVDDLLEPLGDRARRALAILSAPHWLPASALLLHFRDDILPELPELLRADLVRVTDSGSLAVPESLREHLLARSTPEERLATAEQLAPIFRGRGDRTSQIEAYYQELSIDPSDASRRMFHDAFAWRAEPLFAHDLARRLIAVWQEFRDRYGLDGRAGAYLRVAELFDPANRTSLESELLILDQVEAVEDELGAYVALRRGTALTLLNRFGEAREALSRAARLFEALGEPRGVANAYRLLGRLAVKIDRYEEAKSHYQHALALSRTDRRRVMAAQCLQGLAEVAAFEGDFTGASSSFTEAIDLLVEVGGRTAEANVRITFSQLLLAIGEVTAAAEHVRLAAPVFDLLNQKLGQANCLKADAMILLEKGDLDAAEEKYLLAETLFRQKGTSTGLAVCKEIGGLIEQMRGRFEAAADRLLCAQTMFEKIGDEFGASTCLRDRGVLALEQGDRTNAARLLSQSAQRFEKIGARVEAALSTVLAARAGEPIEDDQARRMLAEAKAVLPRPYRAAWRATARDGEPATDRTSWSEDGSTMANP